MKQPAAQQQQPIPTIVNRFELPNIHHQEREASQSSGMVAKKKKKSVKPTKLLRYKEQLPASIWQRENIRWKLYHWTKRWTKLGDDQENKGVTTRAGERPEKVVTVSSRQTKAIAPTNLTETRICHPACKTENTMAEATAVFFFLFSTTGPLQGHTLPLQGSNFFYFKIINFSISYFKKF